MYLPLTHYHPTNADSMINAASGSEVRVITIKALYGADDGINSVYEYQVRNLEHV